jgi:hypothetical protein
LFNECLLLLIDKSLLLNVEFLSLVLKNFFAYLLVLDYTVRVKLSATSLATHDKCRRVILLNFLVFGLTNNVFIIVLIVVGFFNVIIRQRRLITVRPVLRLVLIVFIILGIFITVTLISATALAIFIGYTNFAPRLHLYILTYV